MNIRAIGTFALVGILLAPLAWIVMNGPKVAYAEILGGMTAIGCLFVKRQGMAWTRVIPALFFGLIYCACAYVVREPRDVFPFKSAVVLLFYAMLTGLCLRRLSQDGRERAVTSALICFSLVMSGVALIIMQSAGTDRIVSESAGLDLSRSNFASEINPVSYLGFFTIENIIIGLIPFTLFALSLFPVLLTARTLAVRAVALGSMGLAAYINVEIATRTGLAACLVSSTVILLLVWGTIPFKQRLGFAALSVLLVIVGYFYVTRNKDLFHFLGNRFAEVTQDSRLAIWRESIHILAGAPDGNGIRRLTSHSWAHNMFLDVGLANGWIAMGAMFAFCLIAFLFAWRASREAEFPKSPTNIVMLGWLISGFLALMVLPPLLPLLAMVYIGLAYFAPYRPTAAFEST